MKNKTKRASEEKSTDQKSRATHTVRLPKFLVKDSVGLGQIVKRVTASFGVEPCESCEERAARLDKWLRFSSYTKGVKDDE